MIKAIFVESKDSLFLDRIVDDIRSFDSTIGVYEKDMSPQETLESIEIFLENK